MTLIEKVRLTIIVSIIALVSACTSNKGPDASVTNSINRYIENQQDTQVNIIPILTIYLTECTLPLAPDSPSMLSYELALRDSVVSFKECKSKYDTLREQVELKNKELMTNEESE